MPRPTVDLKGSFLYATAKAVKVDFDGEGDGVWLPLSQVECDANLDACVEGEVVNVAVPEWLAIEKGLV